MTSWGREGGWGGGCGFQAQSPGRENAGVGWGGGVRLPFKAKCCVPGLAGLAGSRGPLTPPPWAPSTGPLTPPLSQSKKLALHTETSLPALLQGDTQFGWGPTFPITAFQRLSIIAYIIFSSPQIINSLRSVDILPSSSLSLSPSFPTTYVSHSSSSGGVMCQVAPTTHHLCLSLPFVKIIRRHVSSSTATPL